MTMRRPVLALALALAACGAPEQASEAPEPSATATEPPVPAASATPSPPVRDYTPPQLTPEAEKGEKGARNLLLAWAQAMEDRAFEAAYGLFGEYAERAGQGADDYAARFAEFGKVTVAIGEGEVEGAAGSLYYEVPVTVTDDTGHRREGTIVLRRVNDVPGATPAQLKWHLERLEWQP